MRVPNNLNIWIQLIKLHLNFENLDRGRLMEAFSEGVCSLNDSLPLWKFLIKHLRYRNIEIVSDIHNII